LKVSVAHFPMTLPTSLHEFPTWGGATTHSAVTTGRPGGAEEEPAAGAA